MKVSNPGNGKWIIEYEGEKVEFTYGNENQMRLASDALTACLDLTTMFRGVLGRSSAVFFDRRVRSSFNSLSIDFHETLSWSLPYSEIERILIARLTYLTTFER